MRRTEIATLTLPPGKSDHLIPDRTVPGLALRLRAGGSVRWIFSFRIGHRQRRITLGSATVLSVQEARRRATQLYASAKLGDDPARRKEEAKQQAAETVGAKLPFFLARQKDRVKNGGLRPRTLVEIERHLLLHAKRLHPKPLVEVTRRDIAELLSALTENLSDGTINRIHTNVMSFFGWAVSEGLLESNPAVGTSRRSEKKQQTRLITDAELRDIWSALRDDAYGGIVRLLILCGARREEIGGLRWDEVDFDTRLITLPPERTKNHREHEIFLTDAALAILRNRSRLTFDDGSPCELVFGRGKRGFNDWAGAKIDLDNRIAKAHRDTGAAPMPDWTLHDFRRLLSTSLNERLSVMPHIVEELLGHVGHHRKGSAAPYNLSLYRAEKSAALKRWAQMVADIVAGQEPKVVPLRAS